MKKIVLGVVFGLVAIFSQGQFKYCTEDLFPAEGDNRLWGFRNLFGEWKTLPLYTKTFPFYGATAIVQQGFKYGVIDCNGKMVIAPEYDEILRFSAGVAWVREGDLWGLINESGEVLLSPRFKTIVDVGRFSDLAWIREGDLWGVYDKFQLKWIYAPKFRVYKSLSREYALIKENGLYGVINCSDSVPLLEPQFTHVAKIAPYKLAVRKDKWGVVNDNGRVFLKCEYDTIRRISKTRLAITKDGKTALVNHRAKVLTPSIYDWIENFEESRALCRKAELYGFLNLSGEEIIPCLYKEASVFRQGRAIVKSDEQTLLLDQQGKVMVTGDEIIPLKHAQLYFVKNKGKGVVVDANGEAISKHNFSDLRDDGLSYYRVKKQQNWSIWDSEKDTVYGAFEKIEAPFAGEYTVVDNKLWGVSDKKGRLILSPKYESVESAFVGNNAVVYKVNLSIKFNLVENDKLLFDQWYDQLITVNNNEIIAKRKGKYGIIDLKESTLLKPKYATIKAFVGSSKFVSVVDKKGKSALYTSKGKAQSDFVFTEIDYLKADYFVVKQDGKYGVLTTKGEQIIACLYDKVHDFDGTYFVIENDGKYGFCDRKGRVKISPKYDEIRNFVDDIAVVRLGENWGAINRRGELVLPIEYRLGKSDTHNFVLIGADRDFEIDADVVEVLK